MKCVLLLGAVAECIGNCLSVGKRLRGNGTIDRQFLGLYLGIVTPQEKHLWLCGSKGTMVKQSWAAVPEENHHWSHRHKLSPTWLQWFVKNNHNANMLMDKNEIK